MLGIGTTIWDERDTESTSIQRCFNLQAMNIEMLFQLCKHIGSFLSVVPLLSVDPVEK